MRCTHSDVMCLVLGWEASASAEPKQKHESDLNL